MTTLTIDNRDTLATIDTYGMFTGEGSDEMEREHMKDEGRLDWDTVDIDYDHKAIVAALAKISLEFTLEKVREYLECKDVTATIVETGSPRWYNYTTDHYVYTPVLPQGVLADYYAKHMDACNTRLAGYDCNDQKENWKHATWCEIVDKAITDNNSGLESELDEYKYHMWECEGEAYYENATIAE